MVQAQRPEDDAASTPAADRADPPVTDSPASEPAWDQGEREAVRRRRERAGLDLDRKADVDDRWGLALSGGGIRSATFCLGLIRGLAGNRLLRRFDYLSTVSGGGYVGASLGRLYREGESAEAIERGIESERSIWLWWLRGNGRFLTPSGVRDLAQAGVSIARGAVATQLELGILLILLSSVLVLPHVIVALLPQIAAWAAEASPAPPFSAWLLLAPIPLFMGTRQVFGFWLTRPHPVPGGLGMMLVYALLLAALGVCLLGLEALLGHLPARLGEPFMDLPLWLRTVLVTLTFSAATAMLFGMRDAWTIRRALRTQDGEALHARQHSGDGDIGGKAASDAEYALRRKRLRYTVGLYRWTAIFTAVILVAALDWISWQLVKLTDDTGTSSLVYGGVGVAALGLALCRALQPVLQKWKAENPGHQINMDRALGVLAFCLLAAIAICWATLVHALVLPESLWGNRGDTDAMSYFYPLWAFAVLFVGSLLFVVLTRGSYDIINMASLHGYYRARIERAYVSTGNCGEGKRFERHPTRMIDDGVPRVPPPNQVVPGDDIRLADYAPQEAGGAIHLINCCINQTVDDGTRYYNGDRKGLSLTLSSLHTVEVGPLPPSPPEVELGYLSKWIAVSGAAASTGMGSMTSSAYSALLFLSGLRLGYWEPRLSKRVPDAAPRTDATRGTRPRRSGADWMPLKSMAILSELFGQFKGLWHRAWYISDGGHFENTALYALIKRQVPLIVAADCGADPKYLFEDLESLVRKARIDFGAEIQFISPDAIDPTLAPDLAPHLGTPESIDPDPSNACLVLGRICYRDTSSGTLLVVKPRRLERLPFDVVAYADRNPEFPQQTTADQFFDESQWESYHRLGMAQGQLLTPQVIAQAQALVAASRQLGSSLSGADQARAKQEAPKSAASRKQRLRPVVAATAAGTGLGLSLVLALWQGFSEFRDERRAELEKMAQQGIALAGAFAKGEVPRNASATLSSLKQYNIDADGSYEEAIAALKACDERQVMACAEFRLELLRAESQAERDYWRTFHDAKPEALVAAEERLKRLRERQAQVSILASETPRPPASPEIRPVPDPAATPLPPPSEPAVPVPVVTTLPAPVAPAAQPTTVFGFGSGADKALTGVCAGKRVYLHVYDETSRPAADCVANAIKDRFGERPVGVENVVATALRRGTEMPWVWNTPIALYSASQRESVEPCADAIQAAFHAAAPTRVPRQAREIKQRSGRDVVEVWLPPKFAPRQLAGCGASAE